MYTSVLYLVRFLEYFAKKEPIAFSYIPKVYLTTFLDAFHVIRRGDPPFDFGNTPTPPSTELTLCSLEPHRQGVSRIVSFFINHFTDARIIHQGTPLLFAFRHLTNTCTDFKKELLQSLAELVKNPLFVQVMENNGVARQQLLPTMINAFLNTEHNNGNWIIVAPTLPALWKVRLASSPDGFLLTCGSQGKAFHIDMKKKNPSGKEITSAVFADVFRHLYASNGELFTNFLNRLFNHSNWTITELEASMRDVTYPLSFNSVHAMILNSRFLLSPAYCCAVRPA